MKKKLYTILLLIIMCNYSKANIADCNPPSAAIILDINNVRTQLMNGGDMFWDLFGGRNASYEIPKNSGRHALFTGSTLMSAIDAGHNLHTAGQTYRQTGLDFWAGPLNDVGETMELSCREWDKMYSVKGSEIIEAKLGKSIAYNVSRWPSAFAQFYDANADGVYDPSIGDYPVYDVNTPNNIPGQMIFWTFNDKGNTHTAYPGGEPLGVEVRATAFAYPSNTSEIINNSTIYRYTIINKSSNVYNDFRVGHFLDYDLGNPNDDYIGCDLSTNSNGDKRNLFYCYNASNDDANGAAPGYGISPPTVGITYLNTGKNAQGNQIGMGSFMFLSNSSQPGTNGDPRNAIELNRYLHGRWADGLPLTYGTPDGRGGTDSTLFAFPGDTDPGGRPTWIESRPPGDRRGVVSTSGDELLPGGIRTIEFAIVWARDSNSTSTNLTNIQKLRLSTDTLINAYKNNFTNFSTGIDLKTISKNDLIIFPNPSNEYVIIKGLKVRSTIVIYNNIGQLVRKTELHPNEKLDVTNLEKGVYYISINKQSLKFIKY